MKERSYMEDVGSRGRQLRPNNAPPRTPTPVARPVETHLSQPIPERKRTWIVIVVIVVLLLALGAWYVLRRSQNASGLVDRNAYQAVHIIDGQLYFGKITEINNEIIKLTDVYYFPPQQSQAQDQEQQQLKLNKLGNEVHGPQDAIYFNRRNVIYWENLKDDGKLVQTIKQNTSN